MQIPITNSLAKDIVLGLEPEGDTLVLSPGQSVIIRSAEPLRGEIEVGFEIQDDLVLVTAMCRKEVWSGERRLR